MFHDGDLQSGIALALSSGKAVACFIRNDSDVSTEWENEWFFDDEVSDILQEKAVLLRIEAGSQEAGFLAAFCPVATVPFVAIIINGLLRASVTSNVSKHAFTSTIKSALDSSNPPAGPGMQDASETASSTVEQPPQVAVQHRILTSDEQTGRAGNSPLTQTPLVPLSDERALRLQASEQQDDQESTNKASQPPKRTAARQDYLHQQRQRNIEARQDRERVLAQIEADKAERRARELERRQEAVAVEEKAVLVDPNRKAASRIVRKEAHLTIRVLDGSSIRNVFPAAACLDTDVRPWISSVDPSLASTPYTFKQMQAPLPARSISVSEEHTSLGELGLSPGASLVLIPVDSTKLVHAYGAGGVAGGLWSLVAMPINLASSAVSGAVSMVSGALGGNSAPQSAMPATTSTEDSSETLRRSPEDSSASTRGNIRIRTLADQRREAGSRDTQFYNGNQLNFEPEDDRDESR